MKIVLLFALALVAVSADPLSDLEARILDGSDLTLSLSTLGSEDMANTLSAGGLGVVSLTDATCNLQCE